MLYQLNQNTNVHKEGIPLNIMYSASDGLTATSYRVKLCLEHNIICVVLSQKASLYNLLHNAAEVLQQIQAVNHSKIQLVGQ